MKKALKIIGIIFGSIICVIILGITSLLAFYYINEYNENYSRMSGLGIDYRWQAFDMQGNELKDETYTIKEQISDNNSRIFRFYKDYTELENPITVKTFPNGNKIIKKDGKIQFIDKNDKILAEGNYIGTNHTKITNIDFSYINENGDLIFKNYEINLNYSPINSPLFVANKDNKKGVIDIDENIIIPIEYKEINIEEKYILVKDFNDKIGCFDIKGNLTVPFIYDLNSAYAMMSHNNNLMVHKSGEKYGIIDISNNKIVLPFEYYPHSGWTMIKKEIKEGKTIYEFRSATDGNLIMKSPIKYQFGPGYNKEDFFKTRLIIYNNKCGIMYDNKIVVQPEYEEDGDALINHLIFRKAGKAYIFDNKGNLMFTTSEDEFHHNNYMNEVVEENFVKVFRNGKFGAIDFKNNILIPFEYDQMFFVDYNNKDMLKVCKNDKWGIIDRKGKEIFPCILDYGQIIISDNKIYAPVSGYKEENIKLINKITLKKGINYFYMFHENI